MKYQEIKRLARKFRSNMTKEEKILWEELRNRKFKGLKFLRQHPIIYETIIDEFFFFVADFYCSQYKLIVELDGNVHQYRKEKDENRDLILKEKGIKVIRILNNELENIEKVKSKIKAGIPSLCSQRGLP